MSFQVPLQRVCQSPVCDDGFEHSLRGPQVHVPRTGQESCGVSQRQPHRKQCSPGATTHLPFLLLRAHRWPPGRLIVDNGGCKGGWERGKGVSHPITDGDKLIAF